MHWREFLDTASRLAQGTTEGDWRSAASRSYYAVFHYFRELLRSHGLDIGRGGQSHFNLYTGLCQCGFVEVAGLANRVDSLRSGRVEADYNLGSRFVASDGNDAVQEAEAVVAEFQALLAALPISHIVDGARRHLQSIGRLGRIP